MSKVVLSPPQIPAATNSSGSTIPVSLPTGSLSRFWQVTALGPLPGCPGSVNPESIGRHGELRGPAHAPGSPAPLLYLNPIFSSLLSGQSHVAGRARQAPRHGRALWHGRAPQHGQDRGNQLGLGSHRARPGSGRCGQPLVPLRQRRPSQGRKKAFFSFPRWRSVPAAGVRAAWQGPHEHAVPPTLGKPNPTKRVATSFSQQ